MDCCGRVLMELLPPAWTQLSKRWSGRWSDKIEGKQESILFAMIISVIEGASVRFESLLSSFLGRHRIQPEELATKKTVCGKFYCAPAYS
jgi:hypothetical protein